MGSAASNWTAVRTLSEGHFYSNQLSVHEKLKSYSKPAKCLSLPSAPQYVSPFLVDSNLTMIWLDWSGTFSLNSYLKEYTVTESQLRVYTGFYSYLHIPRISRKSGGSHTKCKLNISVFLGWGFFFRTLFTLNTLKSHFQHLLLYCSQLSFNYDFRHFFVCS